MNKCPHCFTVIDLYQRTFICPRDSCRHDVPDPQASAYSGVEVAWRPTFKFTFAEHQQSLRDPEHQQKVRAGDVAQSTWPPAVPTCWNCHQATADACSTCHHILPIGWLGVTDVTCIAMSGARASGKSLYIAVGVKRLETLLLEHANSQLNPLTSDVEKAFRINYLDPLYVARGVLESTPVAAREGAYQREPLIFDLGQIGRRRQFLVIRDVAGEEMQSLPEPHKHLEFIARADAVFFLFDSLAVSEIRASLRDVVSLPQDEGGDPRVVLSNVLTIVRSSSGGAGTAPPIAVIVSKFDALEQFRSLEGKPEWSALMSHRGAAFARDGSERALAYDDVDGDLLSAEVRSLILKLGGDGLVSMLENPNAGGTIETQYFAVSALGHAPRGRHLDGRGIAPFRILDPLKWALSRSKAI